MGSLKRIFPGDVTVESYVANKQHTLTVEEFTAKGGRILTGSYSSSVGYLGDLGYEERLYGSSLKHLYYSNFKSNNTVESGSFENYLESTLTLPRRLFPEEFYLISIPRSLYGTSIKPSTVQGEVSGSSFVSLEFSSPMTGKILAITPDSTYRTQQFPTSSTFTVSHNLNTASPFVQTLLRSSREFIPEEVSIVDSNSIQITVSSIEEFNNIAITVGSFTNLHTSSFSGTSASISHTLSTSDVLVHTYDSVGRRILPESINIIDTGSVEVLFSEPVSGSINIASSPSGSVVQETSLAEDFSIDTSGLPSSSFFIQAFEDTSSTGSLSTEIIPEQIIFERGLYDDGEGRILKDGEYVGDIIYSHGMVILPKDLNSNLIDRIQNISFTSTLPIYILDINCKVRDYELNYSNNPTTTNKLSRFKDDSTEGVYRSGGTLKSHLTGSAFRPYVTSIGLYNDLGELLAVAKTSPAIPKSKDTDMTFNIQLDL